MPWRMSADRWRELLAAGPTFHKGDMERIGAKVYAPTVMCIAVRSALRNLRLLKSV